MKPALIALTFRLPSKQLHSAEHTMYPVRKPSWHRLERHQWGCRESPQCCRAKTTVVTEPERCSQHWDSWERQNKPLSPTTRAEKIHLRLHDCHSELSLLSWLWRSLGIFLTSVYLRFSWRAEKDLSGATAAEEPQDRGVCRDVSRASWCLIPHNTDSVQPQRQDVTCCWSAAASFHFKWKNNWLFLFH